MGRRSLIGVLLGAFNLLVYLFLLAPIAVVIIASFNSSARLSFPLEGVSLQWYRAFLANRELLEALRLSAVVALATTALALPLGLLAAFAIDRYRFPGRDALSAFLLSPLLIPGVVLGIGILIFYASVGLPISVWGFVLAHVLIASPYVVRTVLASLARFDRSLEEAAMSLGADDLRTKRAVTLPAIRPGLLAGGIFAFMTSFDNVPLSVFLATPTVTPLPVKIYADLDSHGIDPVFTAVSTVLIVGTLALVLLLDRYVGLERL
ncbi:MAG: ABC transporter permease [Deltaproteobacteria bacterium]|nr:ABC transporter permease [Deltaproteobacteria bacterium]MBI3076049.1 ABC transporter permease [Deltaproteobacteria bacterium]